MEGLGVGLSKAEDLEVWGLSSKYGTRQDRTCVCRDVDAFIQSSFSGR